jgi:hypothetical protein
VLQQGEVAAAAAMARRDSLLRPAISAMTPRQLPLFSLVPNQHSRFPFGCAAFDAIR